MNKQNDQPVKTSNLSGNSSINEAESSCSSDYGSNNYPNLATNNTPKIPDLTKTASSSQHLNVNEDILRLNSSLLSISSSAKKSSFSKKATDGASNLLSSIKNTTLTASRILTKAAASSRSTSPMPTNKKQPIDLEANITVDTKKKKNKLLQKISKLKHHRSSKSEENEESNLEYEYDDDDDDDDYDDDDYEETTYADNNNNNNQKTNNTITNKDYKNVEVDDDDDEDDDEDDDDYEYNYQENEVDKAKTNKKANVNINLYDDEDDDDDNLNSICDLDETYFLKETELKSNTLANKPAKFTSSLLTKTSASSFANKPNVELAAATSIKKPKPININKLNANEDTVSVKTVLANDKTVQSGEQQVAPLSPSLNKLSSSSFKNYNQAQIESITVNNKSNLKKQISEVDTSNSRTPTSTNYLSVATKTSPQPSSSPTPQQTLQEPINKPIKTILSNSNRNLNNLNLANLPVIPHGGGGSRNSVSFSFSDDTRKHSSKDNNESNTRKTQRINYTKQYSLNIDEDGKPMSAPVEQSSSRKDLIKQESIASAPPSSMSFTSPSELAKTKLQCDIELSETMSANKLSLSSETEPAMKKMSAPLDLNLNSSFASTNTGLTLSHQSSLRPNQPTATRVLQKSMTKGSKAMRIMGNNGTAIMGNGPMKNSASSGAVSVKSGSSSMSRASGAKKQQQKRLFFKNGNINISRSNIDKRRRRYLTDIFTTLIDLKWRYNLLVFALGFFISWTIFAVTWYLISYIHGDLNHPDKNHVACIQGIHGFAGAILFSIETQQTIGYGARYTTEKCPEAIFVMMIQSSVGVMIQSFMVGVVFAKLSRPKKRSETLMFSKNAVISLRDGRLCLICRVGDMRKSHIVEAHVRMYMIKKKVSLEGEIMPLHMYDLNVGWDKGLDRLFLVWPLTIEHYIDANSPFWSISAEDLKKERFEIAVILEGIVERYFLFCFFFKCLN